jgi:DNA polymerase-3 subunit delta'
MNDPDHPEPDRVTGAPHPRDTVKLLGQDSAQAEFLQAFTSDKLHHGWLLSGPRGVGKATLAWSIARFLLATPVHDANDMFGAGPAPTTLAIDPNHPVVRRMAAGSEGGLFVLRRPIDDKTKKLKKVITVDEVRALKSFFAMSAADGGRRVVIVDAADEMNSNAANALLKLLEEPPARSTLLLVSHQPTRLLPTIRSRCRELRLASLGANDMSAALAQAGAAADVPAQALAELSGGSVGAAIRLLNLGGLELYADLIGVLSSLPQLDRPRAIQLAEAAAARGADEKLDLILTLIDLALARLARTGVTGHPPQAATPNEPDVLRRLSPTPAKGLAWANIAQDISARAQHGRAVNLDPAALVLDTVFKIQHTAAG